MSITVVLAVITFSLRKRYYPFSDYYMFAFSRTDLRNYSIFLEYYDGRTSRYLSNKELFPISRMHLSQMLYIKSNSEDLEPIANFYFNNFCLPTNCSKLLVTYSSYNLQYRINFPIKVIYEKKNTGKY